MQKSPETAAKILAAREEEMVHLLLCDAVFQFQTWRSSDSHAHLEQPVGSEMVLQEEFDAIRDQTLRARCDMCVAGQLRNPVTGELLQKGTQVLTTSKIMHRYLESQKCTRDHDHDHVAGQIKHVELGRIPLTQYTELYTDHFARKVLRCLRCSASVLECSRISEQPVLTTTCSDPEPKRLKLNNKQPPTEAYICQIAATASDI